MTYGPSYVLSRGCVCMVATSTTAHPSGTLTTTSALFSILATAPPPWRRYTCVAVVNTLLNSQYSVRPAGTVSET